jgi:hypothetical protein
VLAHRKVLLGNGFLGEGRFRPTTAINHLGDRLVSICKQLHPSEKFAPMIRSPQKPRTLMPDSVGRFAVACGRHVCRSAALSAALDVCVALYL